MSMKSQFVQFGAIIGGIVLSQILDMQSPKTVMLLRLFYLVTQLFVIGIYAWILWRVNNKNDQTKIRVPKQQAWGAPANQEEFEEVTVVAYDRVQLFSKLKQNAITFCVILFLHYKFEMVPPLLFQTLLGPVTLYSTPIVQAVLLGDTSIKRPFKQENPFANLMQQQQNQRQPQQQPAAAAADSASENEDEDASTAQPPKKGVTFEDVTEDSAKTPTEQKQQQQQQTNAETISDGSSSPVSSPSNAARRRRKAD